MKILSLILFFTMILSDASTMELGSLEGPQYPREFFLPADSSKPKIIAIRSGKFALSPIPASRYPLMQSTVSPARFQTSAQNFADVRIVEFSYRSPSLAGTKGRNDQGDRTLEVYFELEKFDGLDFTTEQVILKKQVVDSEKSVICNRLFTATASPASRCKDKIVYKTIEAPRLKLTIKDLASR